MTSHHNTATGDLHDLAAPYALHALGPEEAAGFEEHLADCPTCRAEVASFEATTAHLADLSATQPPASLRTDVLDSITRVRQDPSPVADDPSSDPPSGMRTDEGAAAPAPGRTRTGDTTHDGADEFDRAAESNAGTRGRPAGSGRSLIGRLGLGLAAALVIVAGALGLWANSLANQLQQQQDQASQIAAVLGADDVRTIHHDGASLVVSPSTKQAVFAAPAMPEPGDDEVVQLWVIDEQAGPQSAGLMVDTSQPMMLDMPVREGQAVGVTIEPAGGSDQPTTEPVWVGEV